MKRQTRLKLPSSAVYALSFLIGFGAGYGIKEFTPPLQTANPQPIQQISSSVQLPVSVCFTPNKKCKIQIINEISKAKKSILVQAYSFTDREIAQALADASKRGVVVKVLLDKSNQKDNRSAKDIIIHNKIPLRFDAPAGIAHNKLIILDKTTIVGGSYNYSAAAYKRNTENLLIINNPKLAQEYVQNWQVRWELSNKRSEILTE